MGGSLLCIKPENNHNIVEIYRNILNSIKLDGLSIIIFDLKYRAIILYLFICFTTYKKNTRKERSKTNRVHIYARLGTKRERQKKKNRNKETK